MNDLTLEEILMMCVALQRAKYNRKIREVLDPDPEEENNEQEEDSCDNDMNFPAALEALLSGSVITREGDEEGKLIRVSMIEGHPYICVDTDEKTGMPYTFTNEDIFASDWCIVEED